MKYLLLVLLFLNVGCSSKTNKTTEPQKLVATEVVPKKDSVPMCIREIIKKLESEPVTNPPSYIYSYSFRGKTVYYTPPICCDQFSNLYDASCKIIAHPDGGITGKGDGKAPTFYEEKTHEKLIWKDKRKE
jgi:hypothetical protein